MNINQQIKEIETLKEYHIVSKTLTNLFMDNKIHGNDYVEIRTQLLIKFEELKK